MDVKTIRTMGTFEMAQKCEARAGRELRFGFSIKNEDKEWFEGKVEEAKDWALHAEFLTQMNRNNECEKFTSYEVK